MTHLIRLPSRRMASLPASLIAAALVIGTGAALSGCGEEPPPPTKKVTKAPTRTTKRVPTIAELVEELQIDQRVIMTEKNAPTSETERRALLVFFDAWVRGDNRAISSMLGEADQAQLRDMVDEGQWELVTGDVIDIVQIRVGPSDRGDTCVLAQFESGVMNQSQLWRYRDAGDGIMFEAVATPPGMTERLSGDDLIADWWKILEEENAMWDLPDNEQLGDLLAEEEDQEGASSGSNNNGRRTPGGGRRTPGGGRRVPGGR